MYNFFAEHLQINQIIQDWFTSNLCYKPILILRIEYKACTQETAQKTWNAN